MPSHPIEARRLRLSALIPRGARLVGVLGAIGLGLVLAACGTSATPTPTPTPSPSPGSQGAQLVADAAVSATVGPQGGALTAADPERGRSYRLTVPAGAVGEDTQISATPIAAIDGFPLDGGLLGGLELAPPGTAFLAPVSLEIALDAERQAELRQALDAGQAVVGFRYDESPADLSTTLAEVADDLSSVTLTLFGFSGNGAGTGSPQNLANLPCPPDPARAAQCQINRILHPPGGPADPADPAIRGQIANVLRDWLDVLEVVLDDSTGDPADYRSALAEALDWHLIARQYGLVSDVWSGPGDELGFEGARLEDAVFRSYTAGLDEANRDCRLDQTLDELLEWIDIHEIADLFNAIPLPPYSGLGALGPSTFCLDLELIAEAANPDELAEGESGEFRFRIRDATEALAIDTQLDKLRAEVTATPADTSLLTATGRRLSLIAYADVTAVSAVQGNDAEGKFTVTLRLFGLQADYATATATFDITSDEPDPIRCSGDPTEIHSVDDDPERISIAFDGGSRCFIFSKLQGIEMRPADDPDIVITVDTDPGDARWDDEGTGANWRRTGSFGEGTQPGTYLVLVVRADTGGKVFVVTFTVDVSLVGSGPDTRMTVRDVTIRPADSN